MQLTLSPAAPIDAARIAEIHMAAFGANPMLRAQFPTATVRSALQQSIEVKTRADIEDSRISVLVVRDLDCDSEKEKISGVAATSEGTVVSFAKWSHPVAEGDLYVETPWVWPAGTNLEVLEAWTKVVEDAHERLLGRTPCYHPLYERCGAGSLLVKWGRERSKKEKVPLYLESTVEAGPFYEKNGFLAVETISIDSEREVGHKAPSNYQEICFVFNRRNTNSA